MCTMSECGAFFEAQKMSFLDVAEGRIPAHVLAYVLIRKCQGETVQLEEVPIQEWDRSKDNGIELTKAFAMLSESYSFAEATQILLEVHDHIDVARENLFCAPFHTIPQLANHPIVMKNHDLTLKEAIALAASGLTARFKSQGFKYAAIVSMIESIRQLPFCTLAPTTAEA